MPRLVPHAPMTAREQQVAELVARGLYIRQIADALDLERRTVEAYVASAASKLPGDLPPRARLMVWIRGGPREVFGP